MAYGFSVEVQGKYALFSRPELKYEKISYDCITPCAAKGILESILWKPAINYVVDRIHVINKINFIELTKDELSHSNDCALALSDVRYVIDAHFEMTEKAGKSDCEAKFYAMIMRRLRNGQCFRSPYLGSRDFPLSFSLCQKNIRSFYSGQKCRDLGLMLYDMDYSNDGQPTPMFFRACMENGIIHLDNCDIYR
ncbi:MAG: type I-C CRISPR-associated protein Cas5c [Christensenellales bacterium]